MKKGSVILMCIISSLISSSITLLEVKNDIPKDNVKEQTEISENIDSSKDKNIYHAVSDKAMPSVVGITTISIN